MKISLSQPYSFHQLGLRSNQEDARYPDCDVPRNLEFPFFVVCDGVGGAEGGECASQAVCQAWGNFMQDQDCNLPFSLDDFQEGLTLAYEDLHNTMAQKRNYEMATTLAFLCFSPVGAMMAHMGDSRIYHMRPGRGIIYKSFDHSLVNEMVARGEITPQQAEHHPMRNCITRCMAHVEPQSPMPMADVYVTRDVQPGDYFFLCTDGVLHDITDDQLCELLCSPQGTDKEKMDCIADYCKESTDNNTAYLVRVIGVSQEVDTNGLTDEQILQREVGERYPDSANAWIRYGITQVGPQMRRESLLQRISSIFKGKS